MEIANTLEIRTRRHRTTRSFDSSIAPATGPFNLSMVLATGVCPKPHLGARSAPNKMGERDTAGEKFRLMVRGCDCSGAGRRKSSCVAAPENNWELTRGEP